MYTCDQIQHVVCRVCCRNPIHCIYRQHFTVHNWNAHPGNINSTNKLDRCSLHFHPHCFIRSNLVSLHLCFTVHLSQCLQHYMWHKHSFHAVGSVHHLIQNSPLTQKLDGSRWSFACDNRILAWFFSEYFV